MVVWQWVKELDIEPTGHFVQENLLKQPRACQEFLQGCHCNSE